MTNVVFWVTTQEQKPRSWKVGLYFTVRKFRLDEYVVFKTLVTFLPLAGQKLCLLSFRTAHPFPLESFCQHDSGQFPPGKSF